jgi:hypothetical protein
MPNMKRQAMPAKRPERRFFRASFLSMAEAYRLRADQADQHGLSGPALHEFPPQATTA